MEFSFKIDPERDLAIGTELAFEDCDEGEYAEELAFDFSDVDPYLPTEAKPGSIDKVKMLAARYAAGLPLWNLSDCEDHSPVGVEGTGDYLDADVWDEDEAPRIPLPKRVKKRRVETAAAAAAVLGADLETPPLGESPPPPVDGEIVTQVEIESPPQDDASPLVPVSSSEEPDSEESDAP